MKKIRKFFKHVQNSPRIHFGYPRTTTAFKKPKLFQKLGFSGFSIHQIGPFWTHFEPKNFKILEENGQGVVKNWKKKWKFSKNILNFPIMHFGHPRTITPFKNRNFLKIWVFQDFSYTRLGHFGPKNFKILAQNGRGVVKKWKKNLEIFQNYSKLPKNVFWAS